VQFVDWGAFGVVFVGHVVAPGSEFSRKSKAAAQRAVDSASPIVSPEVHHSAIDWR
jgi:hypothetical protein